MPARPTCQCSLNATTALGLTLVLWPTAALAHLVNSGLGPFYDGALHLLMSPADLLGLLAITLLAGMRGARAGRLSVIVLPAAWLVAGMIGMQLASVPSLAWLSLLSIVLIGVLVAADLELAPHLVAALAGLYGTLHGLADGAALARIGAGMPSLSGITAAVLVVGLLGSAVIVSLRAAWARVAVRVIGSWVAAIGLMMLGWTLQAAA